MQYVCGLFGQKRPYMALTFDTEDRTPKFHTMFLPSSGQSVYEAFENQQKVVEMLTSRPAICSDWKGWLRTTDLDYSESYQVYDCGIQLPRNPPNKKQAKRILAGVLKDIVDTKPQNWQYVQAKAQQVYQYLEDRGFVYGHQTCHPDYAMTYSGRSSAIIHGADETKFIRSLDEDDDYFVHFDWIAADLRVLSVLSEDPTLNKSFRKSDPYEVMAEKLGVTRDAGKKQIFQSLYSLDAEGLEEVFPELASWMKKEIIFIGEQGYGESIMGRQFKIEDGRTNKSVFNAKMQGSVAHAMQNVLFRVFQVFPTKILTEVHDSLILTCRREEIKNIVKKVSQIMLHPFYGVLDDNPRFPLKVSVGKAWRKWKPYKEYR